MKINDILLEAIEVNGYELVAYCMVVAEQYLKMPAFDLESLELWQEVIQHNEKMLYKIMKSVNVSYVERDPYKNQKEMMYDIIVNNQLKIFKTPDDDTHPGMSGVENDIFRTVHDYIGHHLPNEKEFVKLLAKNVDKSSEDFNKFRFSRNNFTVRGEMNTYISHGKLLSDKHKPVLFTEIVGQICTYFVTGDFTVNKVGIMKGIDFKNIGYFTDGKLEHRKNKYTLLLEDDSVDKIKTSFGTFDKNTIRWNLLSRGEGQTKKDA